MVTSKTISLFLIIFAIGLLLRIFSFQGCIGSDDLHYAELAHKMATGTFTVKNDFDISRMRIGLVAPVALAFKFMGISEWAMVIYPFLASLAGIILAFWSGRMFFNDRVGLIAALFMAILPFDARFASTLNTDIPSSLMSTASILLLCAGSRNASLSAKFSIGALAGIMMGMAWLTRESAAFLLPFFGAYLLWLAWHMRQNVALLFGAAFTGMSVFIIEAWIYYNLTGDFMYRFHCIANLAQSAWGFNTNAFNNVQAVSVWRRLFIIGPFNIFLNPYFGLSTIYACLAITYAACRKLKPFLFSSLWFLFLVLVYNFGTTNLHTYTPLNLGDRYLYPLLFPAIILTAGLIDILLRPPFFNRPWPEIDRQRLVAGILLTASLVFVCTVCNAKNLLAGKESPVERSLQHILTTNDVIYTDTRTAWVLHFFWKYPPVQRTYDFSDRDDSDFRTSAYVLINRNRVDFLKSMYLYKPPKFYNNIPHHWKLKWSGYNAELYYIPT